MYYEQSYQTRLLLYDPKKPSEHSRHLPLMKRECKRDYRHLLLSHLCHNGNKDLLSFNTQEIIAFSFCALKISSYSGISLRFVPNIYFSFSFGFLNHSSVLK